MARLSLAEKVELGAVTAVTAFAGWFTPKNGVRLELGELVAGAALLLLVQGFFRDLWLLREARRKAATIPSRAAACMCVESAMGLTGIVAGIALVGFGLDFSLGFSAGGLALVVASVMAAGFLLKDFVFG